MKHTMNFCLFLLAFLLAACTGDSLLTSLVDTTLDDGVGKKSSVEMTTTASGESAIEYASKKGAVVEKGVVWDEGTFVDDGPYFIPCLNSGDGEYVSFSGSYKLYGRQVSTPSGNFNANLWLQEWDFVFTSGTSGDTWIGSGLAHVAWHTKTNGETKIMEPLHEEYINQTTQEKLKLLYHFRSTPEVPFSFEVISCVVI